MSQGTARTITDAELQERCDYTAGLRMLADLLDENPNLKLPYHGSTASILVIATRDSKNQGAAWARALPGRVEKNVHDEVLDLNGQISGLKITVILNRDEVCTKVVVGTREVTETVPDPELVAAVPLVKRTVTKEIVEYHCGSLLAGDRS